MKVLLASNFVDETNTGYCIKRALEELKHEVCTVNITRKGNSLATAPLEIIKTNRQVFKYAKNVKPDILMIFKGRLISPSTIKKIKKLGIKTVMWHPDVRYEVEKWVFKRARVCDYFFHVTYGALEQYQKAGIKNIYWLSEGCDPFIHKPIKVKSNEKKYFGSDVAFIGHPTPPREKFMQDLIEGDIDIKVWHHNWKSISKYRQCMNKWLDLVGFGKVCNSTKIMIGNDRWSRLERSLSMRSFMIMGYGGFLLTNHTKGIEKVFKPRVHLDVYENTKDLIEKIEYYLRNEKERLKIQKRGHEEVYKKHTFVHRLNKMFDVMGME